VTVSCIDLQYDLISVAALRTALFEIHRTAWSTSMTGGSVSSTMHNINDAKMDLISVFRFA